MPINIGTIVRPYNLYENPVPGFSGRFLCNSFNWYEEDVCVGIVIGWDNQGNPDSSDNPYITVDWLQQCGYHKRLLIPKRDSIHQLDHLRVIGQTR